MARLVPLLVPTLLFALTGCGTFSDAMCGPVRVQYTDDGRLVPVHDCPYYRGVRFDALAVKEGAVLMAADMPLSAIADTVQVPFIACLQLKNSLRPTDEQAKVEQTQAESTPKQVSLPSQ